MIIFEINILDLSIEPWRDFKLEINPPACL